MTNGTKKGGSNGSARKNNGKTDGKALLRWHKLHAGVYARVARQMSVDPSYVSRVASGKRQSEQIERALLSEIMRIQRQWPKTGQ